MSSLKNEHHSDGSGRRLIKRRLAGDVFYYVLSDGSGTNSFLDDWMNDPRSREKAKRLLSAVLKITRNGLGWATTARQVRRISAELYEIKNFFGASRVMAHIHTVDTIVMLRPFEGHSGTGKIPASIIASATRQQRLVIELLEQEEHDGD